MSWQSLFISALDWILLSSVQALEERDKRIETLKRRLEEAVGDLEANTELMENVKGELGKSKLLVHSYSNIYCSKYD